MFAARSSNRVYRIYRLLGRVFGQTLEGDTTRHAVHASRHQDLILAKPLPDALRSCKPGRAGDLEQLSRGTGSRWSSSQTYLPHLGWYSAFAGLSLGVYRSLTGTGGSRRPRMRIVSLLLFASVLSNAQVNVPMTVQGATATQIVVSYTAPTSAA